MRRHRDAVPSVDHDAREDELSQLLVVDVLARGLIVVGYCSLPEHRYAAALCARADVLSG
jgi:hypothetical protein